MTHHDRRQQVSFAGQTGGTSARDRVLIAIAAIGLGGVLVVGLANLIGADPIVVADDPSRPSASPGASAAATGVAVSIPSPSLSLATTGPWAEHALHHRGADGQWFEYACPANGIPGLVWGTFTYTDYSSVCTAAVHHGVITLETGGTVRIVIRPGLAAYSGTRRNGITSRSWDWWAGSFGIAGPPSPPRSPLPYPPLAPSPFPSPVAPVDPVARPMGGPWAAWAMEHRGANGQEFEYECPPQGTLGSVWGTVTYTDDSSVCTAAVHAGVITREAGGTVRIVIRPGLVAYAGSSRNGVTSEPWGWWDGSFEFVGS